MSDIFFWTQSWLSKKQIPFQSFNQASSSNDLAKQSAFKNESLNLKSSMDNNENLFLKSVRNKVNKFRFKNLKDNNKNDRFKSLKENLNEGLKNQTDSHKSSIQLKPQIFLVQKQSQGRGQGDNKWEDSDLMISFLWDKNLKKIQPLSAEDFTKDLKKALNTVWTDLPLSFKPLNDLYLEDKKTAGLLLEVLNQGDQQALIIGLGLNVFSCPKNILASCLANYIKDINSKDWNMFLDQLFDLWSDRACYTH